MPCKQQSDILTLKTHGQWGFFTVLLIRCHIHLLSLRLHFCFFAPLACVASWIARQSGSHASALYKGLLLVAAGLLWMRASWRPSFSSSIVSWSGCSICCRRANRRMLLVFFALPSFNLIRCRYAWMRSYHMQYFPAIFLSMHSNFRHLFV